MKVKKLNEAKFLSDKKNNIHYTKHVMGVGGPGLYEVELEKDNNSSKTTYKVRYEIEELGPNETVDDKIKNKFKNLNVLHYDEIFNKDDPKFPKMTEQQYYDEGEKLSLEPYGDPGSGAPVIGFITNDKKGNNERAIKIRTVSKFNPNFSDMVIYIDDEGYNPSNAPISTFMLARPGRVRDELKKVNPNKKPTDFKESES